jgi:hypothetical protein
MAPTIEDITEDDISLDNIEGRDDSDNTYIVPNFMPVAWYIMNWFSCPNTGPSTKTCAACKTFGTSLHLVENLWFLLDQEDIQPVSGRPKHLLWALHFMKVYPKQAPGCAAVGVSGGAIDLETHRKWVWVYIKAVAELVDEVVSYLFFFNFILVSDGTSLLQPLPLLS